MKKRSSISPLILLSLLAGAGGARAQTNPQIPPEVQAAWGERRTWPMLAPGSVSLDTRKLVDLRAVYDRRMNLLENPEDRVRATWYFEEARWQGEPALLIAWFTTPLTESESGEPGFSIGYVDAATFRPLLRMMPGAGGSYNLVRARDEHVLDTSIAADGSAESGSVEYRPIFDVFAVGYLFASMPDLEEGMQFRIPAYSPGAKRIGGGAYRVLERERFRDASGRTHTVLPVETLMSPDGWVGRYYLSGEAPYFVGYETRNMVSGQTAARVSLVEHRRLDP